MARKRLGIGGFLGLFVLLFAASAAASTLPKGKRRGRINPHTGRPIVSASGHAMGDAELRALAESHGLADVEKAVRIMKRESGGDPSVVLDTRGMTHDELFDYWHIKAQPELSVGLFQINLLANAALVPGDTLDAKVKALQDPGVNADVARRLSQGGTTWGPWGG
jgi:hypothetical protein